LKPYLAEQLPHVRFTPALKLFSDQVLQGETRPYEVVRKLFAAVDRIPWAGAREYSTLSNISDYALRAGHADCGQQTLLLIALLRMNGIPARWQSGMVFSDDGSGYNNLHDWGQVYLAPYGWLPMDVTTGALASDVPALRDFYLGGLDGYRIAFNDDFGQPWCRPSSTSARKRSTRSAARPSGQAATCTSTNGATTSSGGYCQPGNASATHRIPHHSILAGESRG
jgi:transglutaminase-like putative cysteine protease